MNAHDPARVAEPGDLIAVDWGTSARRAYRVTASGRIDDRLEDGRGVLTGPGRMAQQVAMLRRRLGVDAVLCSGMIGSALGWQDVPYVAVPAGLADLGAARAEVARGVWIVPGVAHSGTGRYDVMRGEETAALGAAAAGLVPPDCLLAMPGTHCKWVRIDAGRIATFSTVMTGELFALMKGQGTLAAMLANPVTAGDSFTAGVDRGLERPALGAALFEARAAVLMGAMAFRDAASFVSGLLIGADVAAGLTEGDAIVHLVASDPLASLYAAALARAGATVMRVDAATAFAAGAAAIHGMSA